MVVDSFLEMYTTLFGWMFYNVIYHVLKDVGLLFLPFIKLIIDHYRMMSATDPSDGDGGKQVLKSFEDRLKWMVIVFMVAVAPFITFDASEIQHRPEELVDRLRATDSINPLYNLATAQANFDILTIDSYPVQVDVPLWWMLTSKLFSGINHKIIHNIPSKRDLAGLLSRSRVSRIRDPELREEVERFAEDCYTKAAADFFRNEDDYRGLTGFSELTEEYGKDDIYYIGSRFFTQYIYPNYRSMEPVESFPYSDLRDLQYADALVPPQWGHPYCSSWWNDKLEFEIGQHVNTLVGYSLIADDRSPNETRYFAVKNALHNSRINWLGSGYDYAYNYSRDGDGGLTRAIKDVVMSGNTVYDGAMTNAEARVMLENAPLAQALIVCVFYAFIIFALFLGGYDLGVAILTTWGFFSVKFLSVCLYMAWWLEQNLIEALFPNSDMIELAARTTGGLLADPNSSFARRVVMLDNATNYLYLGIPTVFILICSWAGFGIASNFKNGMMGGSRGVQGMIGGAGRAVGRLPVKK